MPLASLCTLHGDFGRAALRPHRPGSQHLLEQTQQLGKTPGEQLEGSLDPEGAGSKGTVPSHHLGKAKESEKPLH